MNSVTLMPSQFTLLGSALYQCATEECPFRVAYLSMQQVTDLESEGYELRMEEKDEDEPM